MVERILTQEQGREVCLAYFCGVDAKIISEEKRISKQTLTQNYIGKYSSEWNDPLIELYGQAKASDRGRNAIHLYLFFNEQGEGLYKTDLIDLKRDKPIYDLINNNIFLPKTKQLLEKTSLEDILGAQEKNVSLSKEEKLLRTLFCKPNETNYSRAINFVKPMLYERLRKAYFQEDVNANIKNIYKLLAKDLFQTLGKGFSLTQNQEIMECDRLLKEEKDQILKENFEKVLKTLTSREEEILRMGFINEDPLYTLEEIGKKFHFTKTRAGQIREKALRRIRHPSRSKELKLLLYPIEIQEHLKRITEKSDYLTEDLRKTKEELRITKKALSLLNLYDKNGQKSLSLQENSFLSMPIEEIEFNVRTANCLRKNHINQVGELVQKTEKELLKNSNFGRKSLIEVKEILENMGLSLGMKLRL